MIDFDPIEVRPAAQGGHQIRSTGALMTGHQGCNYAEGVGGLPHVAGSERAQPSDVTERHRNCVTDPLGEFGLRRV